MTQRMQIWENKKSGKETIDIKLISRMFCPLNTSLILASEKYSMWNQRMLCTNVKLSSGCSQSLTLLT